MTNWLRFGSVDSEDGPQIDSVEKAGSKQVHSVQAQDGRESVSRAMITHDWDDSDRRSQPANNRDAAMTAERTNAGFSATTAVSTVPQTPKGQREPSNALEECDSRLRLQLAMPITERNTTSRTTALNALSKPVLSWLIDSHPYPSPRHSLYVAGHRPRGWLGDPRMGRFEALLSMSGPSMTRIHAQTHGTHGFAMSCDDGDCGQLVCDLSCWTRTQLGFCPDPHPRRRLDRCG